MRNKIYTFLLLILMIIGVSTFVLSQDSVSYFERRTLSRNKDIDYKELGDSLNNVLSDQFFCRNFAIVFKNKITEICNTPFNDRLLKIKNGVVHLDNGYYIDEFTYISNEEKETALNKAYNIQEISNKYKNIKTYVYFPTRIEETSLLDGRNIVSPYPQLKEEFITQLGENVTFSSLEINTIEDYYNYYYKTDFHWNGKGVLESYKNIIDMISNDFAINSPKDVILNTYDYEYYGPYAVKIGYLCKSDKLISMSTETSEYKYFINGEIANDKERLEKYETDGNIGSLESDYGTAFGEYDYERIYDFNQPEKPNILIFADSFINPIQNTLASHFNKTIIIDMRASRDRFQLNEYINKYSIDIILFTQYYVNLYFNGYMFVPLN